MALDLEEIKNLAKEKHSGQKRKFEGTDYWEHPRRVGDRLKEKYDDENLSAAGYLHDVIEDTDATKEEVAERANPEVAEIVDSVTHNPEHDNKNTAIVDAINNNRKALKVKLEDRLDNVSEIENTPKDFQKRYSKETDELVERLKNKVEDDREKETVNEIKKSIEPLLDRIDEPGQEKLDKLSSAFRAGFRRETQGIQKESAFGPISKKWGRRALIGGAGLTAAGYAGSSALASQISEKDLKLMKEFKDLDKDDDKFADKYIGLGHELLNKEVFGAPASEVVVKGRQTAHYIPGLWNKADSTEDHYRRFNQGPVSAMSQMVDEIQGAGPEDMHNPTSEQAMKDYEKEEVGLGNRKDQFEEDVLRVAQKQTGDQYDSVDEIPSELQRKLFSDLSKDKNHKYDWKRETVRVKDDFNNWAAKLYGPDKEGYESGLINPLLNVTGKWRDMNELSN